MYNYNKKLPFYCIFKKLFSIFAEIYKKPMKQNLVVVSILGLVVLVRR